MLCLSCLMRATRTRGFILASANTPRLQSDGIVEALLEAILLMIGYYLVVLSSAMLLIVLGVQIFKSLSSRKQAEEDVEMEISREPAQEVSEELGAAVAAVTVMLSSQERASVSAWALVCRDIASPWKIASRSRRISSVGG